jgi:hypothetical protein
LNCESVSDFAPSKTTTRFGFNLSIMPPAIKVFPPLGTIPTRNLLLTRVLINLFIASHIL